VSLRREGRDLWPRSVSSFKQGWLMQQCGFSDKFFYFIPRFICYEVSDSHWAVSMCVIG